MPTTNEYSSTNLNKYQCQHPFAVQRIADFSDTLIKLITPVNHAYILNIGCGEGFDIKNILDKNKSNPEFCCGVDLNFDALKVAQKMLSHVPFGVVHGDIYHLPFELRRFTLILCLEVLEHLAEPESVLKEISQNFNGYCIFSAPNEPLYRLTRLLLFRLNVRQLGNHPEHLNNWSKKAFSRLIKKYFIIDQVVTPFPWTIMLCHATL
ncbi:MAG: class I SAM-dependent methyltransferase [Deltaproteobacteria bacterium]|nr:class I SAM-dependent methyltransferase [Deltaproteobacteria bacterium]